jgi:adenosylhomocysteine nucleosidase
MIVGIIAALPREVTALVHGWKRRQCPGGVLVYTDGRAVGACAGLGAVRAELAVSAAMASMPITRLLSVGLAGACDPTLRVGDIIRAGLVIDDHTGERFEDDRYNQVLVTSNSIASVSDKQRLVRLYGAAAVDMEATAVARLARQHGLEFSAIKAISDEADFALDGLSRFATPDGQFREAAFALHTAVRPATWGKVIALGRNSSKAVTALTNALRSELDWYEEKA